MLTILATREGTSITVIDNVRDGFDAGDIRHFSLCRDWLLVCCLLSCFVFVTAKECQVIAPFFATVKKKRAFFGSGK